MECKRCGVCCEKGGPVLHHEDRSFLQKNLVSFENLRVIRLGELAFNPMTDKVEPAPVEMIKLAQTGSSWECPFHHKDGELSECGIHADRPMECRLLKCWDTAEVEAVIFKDCLSRFDLVGTENPLCAEMTNHEERCSYRKLWRGLESLKGDSGGDVLDDVQTLLREDMQIRTRLVQEYKLNLAQELFYLGQPMFRVVTEPTLNIFFEGDELQVNYQA